MLEKAAQPLSILRGRGAVPGGPLPAEITPVRRVCALEPCNLALDIINFPRPIKAFCCVIGRVKDKEKS